MAAPYKDDGFIDYVNHFLSDKQRFSLYTEFEHKKHGYRLMLTISKRFPNLTDTLMNRGGFDWKFYECSATLAAFQHEFLKRRPDTSFAYWPTPKIKKEKAVATKTAKGLLQFSDDIKAEVCSVLHYDSKTYESLKFTPRVQKVGKQFTDKLVTVRNTKLK